MNKGRKIATILLSSAFVFGVIGKARDSLIETKTETCFAQETINGLSVAAKSAYLMESETETPLYEKEANKRLPIASMCKIMTLLLSFEGIESGVLTMDEEICVSENAAAMGGSQVFLEANAKYPVRELIKSIVVCSANDSCVAMAETLAGSESLFVEKMNEKAKELGLENTLFANCTGLPKEPQYSSAKDVAKMLNALIKHEKYFEFGKIWMDKFQHPEGRYTEISNTNRLIRFYEGCDGGKTGFTNQAGFCLAATAKRGNMRVISVVIGEENSKKRFEDVKETFDYAFANYSLKTAIDCSVVLEEKISMVGGKRKEIGVKPQRDSYVFGKKGEKENVSTEIRLEKSIKAPVKAGDMVGEIVVYKDGIQTDLVPLIAIEDCGKANLFDGLKEIANSWNLS